MNSTRMLGTRTRRAIRVLLLGVGVVGLASSSLMWARSYGTVDQIWWTLTPVRQQTVERRHLFFFRSLFGRVQFLHASTFFRAPPGQALAPRYTHPQNEPAFQFSRSTAPPRSGAAFDCFSIPNREPSWGLYVTHQAKVNPVYEVDAHMRIKKVTCLWGNDETLVSIPYWLLELIFASTTLPYLRARFAARRCARLGLCLACGYDLRASPDRCPECGTPAMVGRGKRVKASAKPGAPDSPDPPEPAAH